MKKVLYSIVSATLGLCLATLFIPGVAIQLYSTSGFFGFHLAALWEIYLLLGITLGLLNRFVKPVLKLISLPLEIVTLGLFTFIINAGLIWVVDKVFKEFSAPLFWPLFWTTLIIWLAQLVISLTLGKLGSQHD